MNKLLIAFGAIFLLACGSTKNAATTTEAESANEMENQAITFDNISLQLLSIKTDDRTQKTGDIEITLYVDVKGGNYSGKNACNSYFGSVQKIGEDQLSFKMGGSTEMMCDSLKMSWEAAYYNALLGKSFSVYTNETNAIFTEVDGNTVLSYKKVEALQE